MAESHREEIAKLEALYAGNPAGRVFVHLAEAYRKAGEHERARRILDEGLARHVDSASGYVVLGRVLADMQIVGEAESAFRRVLELDGGNLVALRWLGDLARKSGRNTEAAAHYRELLIRNPSNEEVRDLLEIIEREQVTPESGEQAASGFEDWSTPASETASSVSAPASESGSQAPTGEDLVISHGGVAEAEPAETTSRNMLHDWQSPDETAVAGPIAEAEEAAVTPPAESAGAAEPDITPWSAAPGQTPDTEAPAVEYGLVDLDASAEAEVPTGASAAARATPAGSVPEVSKLEQEADIVASTDEDGALLELDDLRRDDEAEPVEIHLLDPSYESATEKDEDFATDLDLTDLAAGGGLHEEGDYADDTFFADLSAGGAEEPEPDELPVEVDLLNGDSALTLLPDEVESEDAGGVVSPAAAAQAAEAVEAEVEDKAVEAEAAAGETGEFGVHEPAAAEYGDVIGADEAGMVAFEAEEPGTDEIDAFGAWVSETTDADRSGIDEETGIAGARSGAVVEGAAGGTHQIEPEQADLSRPEIAALSGAAKPASEVEAVEEAPAIQAPAPDRGLVTETMAVLYRSQGFHDRAADVYRALLRDRPEDARLAAKLREAEESAGRTATRSATEDDAGEVWLRGVATAWAGGAVDATEATPYAWTDEPEEVEAGEPIGSYLRDLVTWRAGAGRWAQPEDAGEEDAAEPAVELPEWLGGGTEAEPWSSDSAPAAIEPTGPDAAGAAPSEPEAEGWSASEQAADPWDLAPEPAVEPDGARAEAAEEMAPWEANHAGASADVGAAPGDEEPGGWTPMNIEREIPAPAAPAPASSVPTPEPAASEDDGSEDEDLEMFRSWLQSLKK